MADNDGTSRRANRPGPTETDVSIFEGTLTGEVLGDVRDHIERYEAEGATVQSVQHQVLADVIEDEKGRTGDYRHFVLVVMSRPRLGAG